MEGKELPPAVSEGELLAMLRELRDEVRGLGARVAQLEGCLADAGIRPPAVPAPAAEPAPVPDTGITEEELLAISAAVAAYLGVRAHIRQVRLIQSAAWGQVGRLNVHASHQRRR
ncbi:hypothetical protein [Zoogloea sp.]|uniref:hypothetical protein n=1 Tax=Zoogloea sp. TaxID=49181 RepID=UPI0035AF29F3